VVDLGSTDPGRLPRPLAGCSTFAADDRAAGREYVSLLTHGKGIPSSRRRAAAPADITARPQWVLAGAAS